MSKTATKSNQKEPKLNRNELLQRIKKLTPDTPFRVGTELERVYIQQHANTLRKFGAIDFKVSTEASEKGGFIVYIPKEPA